MRPSRPSARATGGASSCATSRQAWCPPTAGSIERRYDASWQRWPTCTSPSWGERFPDLCTLEDRYHLLSPRTARREQERGERVGDIISLCWELFAELVPVDIATAISTIANRPALLAEQLDRCEQTLLHGDVRLNNLGFFDDRVVLVDWGERTGGAPAAVELASFLVFDAKRLDVSRDDVISDFRSLYGNRFDESALQLALIGGFVQLGCHFVLPIALGGGDEARAAARAELEWWTPKVASALETWSPI